MCDEAIKDWQFSCNLIFRLSLPINERAIFAIKRVMDIEPNLKETLPNIVDENLF